MTTDFLELVQKIRAYDPQVDEDLLRRAHDFATVAHAEQKRASGEPYVAHPVEVASILSTYRVDAETIAGAMLHDTVEDSTATLAEVEEEFGPRVAHLVDGVTKVARLRVESENGVDAENLHKMMLAMAEDVRVLVIKLADRLHNMRTIDALKRTKRERIARETLDVYAPLAARIGMHEMREELEDLAFEVLNPKARKAIMQRFVSLIRRSGRRTQRIAAEISAVLQASGIEAEVVGRDKRPYSIWRKLEHKEVEFGQLADISAFRVLVDQPLDCYRALGILHTKWPLVPGRLKDYVSVPKPNGYQSLHTTVVGPDATRMEVQIRTRDMHERAEGGIAAHWLYKTGGGTLDNDPFHDLRDWIDSVRDSASPAESLEFAASESLSGHVYCFTPKGRIIHLPRGATPVDFAYAVHTEIGNDCVGAKINGNPVPLFQPLKSGQEIEILRSRSSRPHPEWEADVVTTRARSAIRRAVREREEQDRANFGERLVKAAFRKAGHEPTARAFALAARRLHFASAEKLFSALGRSNVTSDQIVQVIYPAGPDGSATTAASPDAPHHAVIGLRGDKGVEIASCCSPLPGERIVGVSIRGRGMTVHTIDCESLASPESDRAKWADLRWDEAANALPRNRARLEVAIANQTRSLGKVCDLIGRYEANIEDLTMLQRHPDYFRIRFEIGVRDAKHMSEILTAVNAESVVASAVRIRDRSGTRKEGP